MWCFHLGVQTPINPFHHCFTILMMMIKMMVMVMTLEYQNIARIANAVQVTL